MSEEKKSFWTSLPGILTGLATLIGAVSTIYFTSIQDSHKDLNLGDGSESISELAELNETLSTVGSPAAERMFELLPLMQDYLNNTYRHPKSDVWVILQSHPSVGGYVTYGSDRSMPVELPYASFPEGQWVQATTKDGHRLPLMLQRVGLRMFGKWLK